MAVVSPARLAGAMIPIAPVSSWGTAAGPWNGGIVSRPAGVWLVAAAPGEESLRRLLGCSGAGFGSFFALIVQTGGREGFWATRRSRITGHILALGFRKQRLGLPPRPGTILGGRCGGGDMWRIFRAAGDSPGC